MKNNDLLPLPRFGGEGRGEGARRGVSRRPSLSAIDGLHPLTPTLSTAKPGEREKKRLAIFALLLLSLGGCSHSSTTPERKTEEISFPIEAFELTERTGKKVRSAELRGKVWIASFVFTRCTGTCKQITATMERLQGELANETDLRLVTFTVDPTHDDAAELQRYAERHHADKNRWLFLTGAENEIHRLLKESFKVPVARNEKGKPGDEYDHSTRLVVVDRQGNVRGYYQGIADESGSGDGVEAELKKLKEKIKVLLNEP